MSTFVELIVHLDVKNRLFVHAWRDLKLWGTIKSFGKTTEVDLKSKLKCKTKKRQKVFHWGWLFVKMSYFANLLLLDVKHHRDSIRYVIPTIRYYFQPLGNLLLCSRMFFKGWNIIWKLRLWLWCMLYLQVSIDDQQVIILVCHNDGEITISQFVEVCEIIQFTIVSEL